MAPLRLQRKKIWSLMCAPLFSLCQGDFMPDWYTWNASSRDMFATRYNILPRLKTYNLEAGAIKAYVVNSSEVFVHNQSPKSYPDLTRRDLFRRGGQAL